MSQELQEIQEDPTWIETHENKRDLLVSQGKQVFSLRNQLICQYKTCLEEMMDQVTKSLEKHKNKLFEELDNLIKEGKNDLVSNLEENLKIIQTYDFRDAEELEKVFHVKELTETVVPSAVSTIELLEKKLETYKLDPLKMKRCQEELIGFIENIHIRNLCSSNEFQSVKGNDVFAALVTANEALTQSLEKIERQVEDLKKENLKLKDQNTELDKKLAHFIYEDKLFKVEDSGLDILMAKTLKPKEELLLGWGWSSTQKSWRIELSEDLMKATKTGSSHASSVIGSMEMSHGRHQWEIGVSCPNIDKSGFAFGVIEPRMIEDIEHVYFSDIIGLVLNGEIHQGKMESKLISYERKVYLCQLDCNAGTFTISYFGTVVYRQQWESKNKVFVPIVVMYFPGSFAKLQPAICVL